MRRALRVPHPTSPTPSALTSSAASAHLDASPAFLTLPPTSPPRPPGVRAQAREDARKETLAEAARETEARLAKELAAAREAAAREKRDAVQATARECEAALKKARVPRAPPCLLYPHRPRAACSSHLLPSLFSHAA